MARWEWLGPIAAESGEEKSLAATSSVLDGAKVRSRAEVIQYWSPRSFGVHVLRLQYYSSSLTALTTDQGGVGPRAARDQAALSYYIWVFTPYQE